jgi:hypothetical protein
MKKKFLTENGITHFSRTTERIIFFVLTVGMLLWLGVEKLSDLVK